MNNYKDFETERLILKPISEEDAEFVLELFNAPNWIKYIGDRNVKTIDDSKEYIRTKMLPQQKKLGYSVFTIIKKPDNCKIGTCGLYDREGLDGIDIGFAFLLEYERKGYGFESVKKLIDVAFTEFGISEINVIIRRENIVSQKLLEKLGLKLVGITKVPNHHEEVLLYKTKK